MLSAILTIALLTLTSVKAFQHSRRTVSNSHIDSHYRDYIKWSTQGITFHKAMVDRPTISNLFCERLSTITLFFQAVLSLIKFNDIDKSAGARGTSQTFIYGLTSKCVHTQDCTHPRCSIVELPSHKGSLRLTANRTSRNLACLSTLGMRSFALLPRWCRVWELHPHNITAYSTVLCTLSVFPDCHNDVDIVMYRVCYAVFL